MVKYKILYVDDEDGLLMIGKAFLEKKNPDIKVSTALSPKKAFDEHLDKESFDLIISDYEMPGMNGIEFLKKIKNSHLSDIPFILFTGREREEIVIEALNNGASYYLQKGGEPLSQFSELASKVRQGIDQSRMRKKIKKIYDLTIHLTTSEGNESEEPMQIIIDAMQNLLCVDASHISIIRDNKLCNLASVGIRSKQLTESKLSLDIGVGGLVISSRKGYIVKDYMTDENIIHPPKDIGIEEGIVSGMAAPIQFRNNLLGVLYVFSRTKQDFSNEDLETLSLFGNIAAIELNYRSISNL